MKKNILITGGTGFLGSNLVHRLLLDGHKVHVLIRADSMDACLKRLRSALYVIDPLFDLEKYDYEILQGDITLPDFGIAKEKVNAMKGHMDELWHCAAVLSFSFEQKQIDLVHMVNIQGTKHALELATDLGEIDFHYVSTAYIAGHSEGLFLETNLKKNQYFKNTYEKTKFQAEQTVHKYTGKYNIFRPSIIVGNSSDGNTLTFSGFYYFYNVLHILKRQILKRIENDTKMYTKSGILLNEEKDLVLPIIIPCNNDCTINIVPIDWVIDIMTKIAMKSRATNTTYNITHPSPPNVKWLILEGCKVIGIKGLKVKHSNLYLTLLRNSNFVHDGEILQRVQEKAINMLELYLPYMWLEPQFDNSNVRKTLNSKYYEPPEIDSHLVQTLLGYAEKHSFKN